VAPDLPPLADCVPLEPPPGIRHFDQADARIDPAHVPFSGGAHARLAGHVRPLEPRPIDAAWLTMILDWFPPSPFSRHLDPAVGGVSVDFNAHLHRTLPFLGPEQWLVGDFAAEVSADGLALEHGKIFGPDGRLLAESFHTRWTR
jgi:acyl-CoA thioesterase